MTDTTQPAMTDLRAAIMKLDPPKGIAFDYITGFKDARHAAAELVSAALSAPAGWKLVPIYPTDAMIDATYHGQPLNDIWHDMVSAAPSPQEPTHE